MEITDGTAQQLGLTADEFERITQILGRTPNFTELSAYSVMWSEHCSYKNSIRWLKTLPRDGERVLVKAGEENAGLLDIGDGYNVVFKIESHNHPSAIEPFQGAATGVGGIHRDIFTMGARPIAALNSLRFGNINDDKTKHLLNGVVHGIAHYGNCFGVATVGGEIYFEDCYHTNPLVNAMSVGVVRTGQTVSASADGPGNPVFIVGSATGRDGMGGAAFASADLSENSIDDLPAVQVGDPFQEKKLLEACLEIIPTGAIVGMQDMGAAGIICSTAETSAKSGTGMHIQLDKVPVRETISETSRNMKPWELLLSESQERMLIIVKKGREQEVLDIFDKWDLPCSEIGEVTTDGFLRFFMHGELVAELPAESLVLGGGAPVYEREYSVPGYMANIRKFNAADIPVPENMMRIAEQLIVLPNVTSKRWVYEQYDSMVGAANTSTNSPSDAAVIVVKPTRKGLALTTDCNSRYVYADPYIGSMIAVAEAARNIVCSGGVPIGVTNCLNFGNPYNPEVYYQFVNAIRGMSEACLKFGTPVTGGNVSFYNQSPDGPVYPTPTIGMVGLLEDIDNKMSLDFKQPGDTIFLIGMSTDDINCSEYLHKICGVAYSPPPHFDIDEEFKVQLIIKELIKGKHIVSAHDVSEGGLFVTLCESAFNNKLGFDVTFQDDQIRKDAVWFGEGQSRVVVSVRANSMHLFKKVIADHDHLELGIVTEKQVVLDGQEWGSILTWKEKYDHTIEQCVRGYMPE